MTEEGSSARGLRITRWWSARSKYRASRRSRPPSTTYFAGSLKGTRPEARIRNRRYRLRYALLIAGGLMVLVGGVWLLQGVGILPGSFMTGQPFWAMMGAIFLAVGGVLVGA